MITILFMILFVSIFWKLIKFSWKAAWGLAKLLLVLVFLPLILVGLVLGGLLIVALPVLLIVGIAALAVDSSKKMA